MENILKKLTNKQNLNFDESKGTFEQIMTGQVNEEYIYKFLTLLSEKGETCL